MEDVRKWLLTYWRALAVALLGAFLFLFLFSFQLNSLTGGFSKIENAYIQTTSSFTAILKQPIFLPHKLLSNLLSHVPVGFSLARIPSVLLMCAMIISFYALLHRWYTRRIALLATLLFVTSGWTLVIGRQALPTVLYLGWLPILALMYWTIAKQRNIMAVMLWVFGTTLSLYVPGMLWFIVVLGISQKKRLKNVIGDIRSWQLLISLILFVILASPFIFRLVDDPTSAFRALGIPTSMAQVTNFPRHIYQLALQIFVWSDGNPVFHVGRLPYLDIASTVLFLLGIYRLRYTYKNKAVKWSAIVALGWVIGVGFGSVNIAILLPLIYIIIAGGISFLLVQWFSVFPKNPFARSFGTLVVTALVGLISFYHLTRYFIAWPMNPQTRDAFSVTDDRIKK